ncbi:hypothetical protein [Pseudoalteromonas luteoviolacea]|uniref:Uncharacterized protein n=1 Tax=Pseudoalteromonas luteoviolacea S4054 TaxID=1129367 RepID=A0A0F6AA06_9GAMM|nr:hypothetical protein [Pseudoalteromonas luteoviolacea]AOT07364.1 hypothetical protein S4054249_05685 [Pseudoalteromonas luteoviolacea]AOT12279.1 hypothetical protein S40542_05685 [Pseudoalteromonas luteoviolacea]AOT17192.1 hypothetical protein S4054_05685 [Pseudoalteromonas luteoviolacea]KKE83010.1 hypothetical protein N479_01490 [Pseudoalteromonas luteoviolacea S4054]KZN72357.1 hypothetical protein N481_15695 [Pseudoalteromonas luteoviolacea S4047-1]
MTYLFLIIVSFGGALLCRKLSINKLKTIERYLSSAYPRIYHELSLDRFDIGKQASFEYNLAECSSVGKINSLGDSKLKNHMFELFAADVGALFFSFGCVLFLSIMVLDV